MTQETIADRLAREAEAMRRLSPHLCPHAVKLVNVEEDTQICLVCGEKGPRA